MTPGGTAGARAVHTVSSFTGEVRRLLESSYPELWIEGEITNLSSPASGHSYFSLADDKAQVRCALFRQRKLRCAVGPRNGLKVLLRARVSLYEARGDFQLIVDYMEDAGEGALRRAIDELKRRLDAEGLFDAARKRPLPALPRCVGVISSPTGAALRDILVTLRRAAPWLPVVIYPATVQGDGAPGTLVAALGRAAERAECDVIVLARGGGSLEDLMAFNDESVVRAVAGCPIPVVSGVGHETDVSLVDFAADERAATPTAAAQRIAAVGERLAAAVDGAERRLAHGAENRLFRAAQGVDRLAGRIRHPLERVRHQITRVDHARARLLSQAAGRLTGAARDVQGLAVRLGARSPAQQVAARREAVERADIRLRSLAHADIAACDRRLDALARHLEALSPRHTLARGYAILLDPATGAVVNRVGRVRDGQSLEGRLADGRLSLTVKGRREE